VNLQRRAAFFGIDASAHLTEWVNHPAHRAGRQTLVAHECGSKTLTGQQTRNRAIIDLYEPGSTMKAFTIAAGLEEALANRFVDLGKKVGAVEFVDGAGDHAIFISGSSIWRSNDLHRAKPSLFETKLKPGLKVVSAFVRADGVAAIVTVGGPKNQREAWLQTGPRGALVKSPYLFSKLDRVGNHIIDDRWGCPSILGQDGRSWWAPDQSLDKAEAARIANKKPKSRNAVVDLEAPENRDVDLEVDGFALPSVNSTR
jgi:hypothetical protein